MTVKVGIDGYNRSPEQDEKISADMGALFASPSGASVLSFGRTAIHYRFNRKTNSS